MADSSMKHVLDNKRDRIGLKLLKSTAVSLFLMSLLLFFGPATIYMNNAPEFEFTLLELIQHVMLPLLVYSGALLLILMLLPQKWKLHQVALTFLLALGIAMWAQATLLPWSHGVFDGAKIEWERYTSRHFIDGLLWLFIALIFILKRRMIYQNAHKLALVLLLVQTIGLAFLYADIRENEAQKSRFQLSQIDKFNFSKEKNVLIIMLDTTEVPLFESALELYPEYREKLDGFYFFPDTLSSYPSTLASVAHMLTGKLYKNEQPFNDFKKMAFLSDDSLSKRFKEEGFHTFLESLYLRALFIDPAVADNVIESSEVSIDKKLLRFSVFRQLPFPAKRFLVEHISDIPLSALLPTDVAFSTENKPQYLDTSAVPYPEDFSAFRDGLNHSTRYDFNYFFKVGLSQPSFKFYHLWGTHLQNRELAKSKSRMEDLDVCMQYMFDIIKTFKKNGIYDDSVMVILADHGRGVIESVRKSNFNPILLVKPMHSSGPMKVSDRPLTLGDLPEITYALSSTNNPCEGNLNNYFAMHPAPEVRYIYHYLWNACANDHFPQLTEYSMTGNVASNPLVATGRSYVKHDQHVIDFDGHAVIDFLGKNNSEHLEDAWEKTDDGARPGSDVLGAPSVVINFAHPLSQNISYHAELVYAYPGMGADETKRVAVRQGMNAYTKLEATSGIATMQVPLRIYAKGTRELWISFKVPPDSTFVLKSLALCTKPPPMVSWGERYRLTEAFPDNLAFLGQGWHELERNFTWAGAESKVLLRFRVNEPANDLAFIVTAAPFLKSGFVDRQRVSIFANGHKVREMELTTPEEQDYYIEIPKQLVISNQIAIRFDLPDATVPAESGDFDVRSLAIRVTSFSLTELATHYVEGSENMEPYLSSGWSWREQDRIWSDGPESKLGFRVGKPEGDLELVFRCEALIAPGTIDRQRIVVSANGKELKTYEKTTPENECFKVHIPKELVSSGDLHITFGLPDAISPQEAGISADSRTLAIALTSIMLKQ